MAINLFNKYGSRANPPSIDYPQGSVKNRSAPDVKDGTPLDADWANDHQGFFQSILSYFGVTANGTPDKVGASQYFDALMSDPTVSRRGMPLAATNDEVATGENGSKMVTPASLRSAYELPLGQNQTWQTQSRSAGVIYTNTTGRAIAVLIRGYDTGTGYTLKPRVNGAEISTISFVPGMSSGTSKYFSHFFIVPDGATYGVATADLGENTTIASWSELR